MKKIEEIVNYEKFNEQNYNALETKTKAFFTLYLILDTDDIDFNTIYSSLNQTFIDFEFLIFVQKSNLKNLKNKLDNQKIIDKRIQIIDFKKLDTKFIAKNSNGNYVIQLRNGVYLERTFLELAYYNIKINNDVDVLFANSVNLCDKKLFKNVILNKAKRYIDLFTETFIVKKEAITEILNNNFTNKNFVHIDYYGVYEQKNYTNKLKITGEFINYPKSCTYNYNSEPQNITFDYNTRNYQKAILCIMPWGKIGGADIFNLNIIKYLNSKGYKVFIITTEVCNYENRENFEKVSEAFYDLTTFLPREYWANFIENIIKQYNIKLIFQMNSLYFYHLMPWIKYKYPKLPIIEYLHAEDFSWRNGGYPKDSTAVVQFIDKTYVCNNHLKEVMLKEMNRKENDVETLYIGTNTDIFNPSIVEITDKETKSFCKNKKVILFPSRFSYEKRPIFMLNIMKKIKEKRNDIVCIMVGDGEVKNQMINYINGNHLKDTVKMIPMQQDIRQYYKMANVVVICSLTEGITLTTYESLAMNIPVITADVGGQKEIINQKNGIVIKKYQSVKNDLHNFKYSDDEINEYVHSIYKLVDAKNNNNDFRKDVIKNYSHRNLLDKIENDISKLIKTGSKFDSKLLVNENFAIRYLVLYNETSKLFFNNSFEFEDYKQYIKNKLGTYWWCRTLVRIMKKTKLDIFIKKHYFKEN